VGSRRRARRSGAPEGPRRSSPGSRCRRGAAIRSARTTISVCSRAATT
jgi:hypothetical protein